jgi:hypothetical protein
VAILYSGITSLEGEIMEKTECYKCSAEIEVADITIVHPLCQSCEQSFDDWFERELIKLDGRAS